RFINCKHGREPITYDIPVMEKYLKETYGVTVYQEQVMLLSRLLANFTRGESDTLRKAMGKKQIDKMMELKGKFLEGGQANGHPQDKLEKIWADWEKFASYAFNKSHAACYSWVAYQTAYLKAHYTAEYMAAVLTSEQADNKRVTELMEDCRKNGIDVMLPSINESGSNFSANSKGQIRFGLQGIVGMGEAAASAIISEREANGPFTDIFDFLKRVNLRTVNRKNVEVLIKAGAFDGLGDMHRAQYFVPESAAESSQVFLDRLIRWAIRLQENKDSRQMSIFDISDEIKDEDHPQPPQCEPWSTIEQCKYEKEVVGFYLSAHPLDDFKYELHHFAMSTMQLSDLESLAGKPVRFGGIVSAVRTGYSSKNGAPYGIMTIEDYDGSYDLALYDDAYLKHQNYFVSGLFVFCRGTVKQWTQTNPDGTVKKSKPRIVISEIVMLNSVLEKYSKKVLASIALSKITPDFVSVLRRQCDASKGNVPVEFSIRDDRGEIPSLRMSNPNLKVNPRDFMMSLRHLEGVEDLSVVAKSY
ncbi:MAG: DNA polymerase III subunit alpha, partial [Bacteroidales bacterium]|nr:DNA polymerase III subunit alpha [Bacteroidales bacterium]